MQLPILYVVVGVVIASHVHGMEDAGNSRPSEPGAGTGGTLFQNEPSVSEPNIAKATVDISVNSAGTTTSDDLVHEGVKKDDTAAPRLVSHTAVQKSRPGGARSWLRKRWVYAAGVAAITLLGAYAFRKARERRRNNRRTLAMAASYLRARAEASGRIAQTLQKKERAASWFIPNARNAVMASVNTPRHEHEKEMREGLEMIVGMLESQRNVASTIHRDLSNASNIIARESTKLGKYPLTEEEEADAVERGRIAEAEDFLNRFLAERDRLRTTLTPNLVRLESELAEAERRSSPTWNLLADQLVEAGKGRTAKRLQSYVGEVVSDLPSTVGMSTADFRAHVSELGGQEPQYVVLAKEKLNQLRTPPVSDSDPH
ncbi:conserved hypothetical protein [Neospora caninum Liverpool]|uniref:Transmembrane protein n=1 Tax=Neospora caninum (strain Liverpool) TaxID=572307 RepID=F0VM43_NEOCL|nr:conserved hypothetical protein [Neospora caninum Liverpool]CBZ54321.1 conserved hypothetical protein [Neospora caninum Liverpool]CEL69026.1 TPA: hypothetical protein BN1204_047520 [Neospora caninum Liverpool]|eukprot:XP_003884352.1 conserved hypothetical protein [Neospora caninum Liverpool]